MLTRQLTTKFIYKSPLRDHLRTVGDGFTLIDSPVSSPRRSGSSYNSSEVSVSNAHPNVYYRFNTTTPLDADGCFAFLNVTKSRPDISLRICFNNNITPTAVAKMLVGVGVRPTLGTAANYFLLDDESGKSVTVRGLSDILKVLDVFIKQSLTLESFESGDKYRIALRIQHPTHDMFKCVYSSCLTFGWDPSGSAVFLMKSAQEMMEIVKNLSYGIQGGVSGVRCIQHLTRPTVSDF